MYKQMPDEKRTKIPLTKKGTPASTTDPATWFTYDEVRSHEKVGFVFTKDDHMVAIDLDHVLENRHPLHSWVDGIVRDCSSYTEVSPSGTGLHTIGAGIKPGWLRSRVDMPEGSSIEVYDSGRYFTMTGDVFEGYSEFREIDVARVFDFLKPSFRQQSMLGTNKPFNGSHLRVSVHQIVGEFREGQNSAHPFHGSTTGSNFMVDKGGETWRCWRHGVTGNALHLLGQRDRIIECGEKPSGEKWREIIEIAKKEGLIPDRFKLLQEEIRGAKW